MDAQQTPASEPHLKRADETIEDLEPGEGMSETAKGGDVKLDSIE